MPRVSKVDKPKNIKLTLKKLGKLLSKYKIKIVVVLIFAILSTIFSIIGPTILGNIITEIYNGVIAKITNTGSMNMDLIIQTILILLGIYVASALCSFFSSFIMNTISTKTAYRLRDDISKKINKLPLKYFDKMTHGEILSRMSNDVDTVSQNLSNSLHQCITSVVTIIGVLVMMLRISGIMTLASLLVLPITFGGMIFIASKSQKYFKKQQELIGDINGIVEEVYGSHEVVKSFNAEKKVINRFNKVNDNLYEVAWKSQFISSAIHPLTNFVGNLSYVVVSLLGGYLAINGRITVGNIVSFTQYVKNLNQPITQFAELFSQIQLTLAAAERVFEFLDEDEESLDSDKEFDLSTIKGNIEFKNVKFGYNEDKVIIKDFSAKVKEGTKVAIVGPTGAGKTTIVKLLMRFYDLNSGSILLDGIDTKEFKRGDLRSLFGMVLQDTWLYSGTIADNIRYGKLDASLDEVIDAAKAASVHHFIKTLPDTYDLVLNEDSDNISQGQKQLLTIARVILADPKILIFDEATSSVDTRTEVLIQKAMDKLMEGRTSFIIAHRLSTIKNADLILVMKDGDIVETGNHKELLKKNGFYASLYNSQFEEI